MFVVWALSFANLGSGNKLRFNGLLHSRYKHPINVDGPFEGWGFRPGLVPSSFESHVIEVVFASNAHLKH